MAIEFGIVPPGDLDRIGATLATLVEQSGGRIATGFLGTPLVLPALTRTGQTGAAYRLIVNEDAPGWLYQVANGATTLWERWDAILPGGAIHTGGMAAEDAASMISFNHYAYGSVGAWLYRGLAGIAPDAVDPGYRLIHFRPQPGGGLSWAEASIDTPFGRAAIRWDMADECLTIELHVPPGAQGRLQAPAGWTWSGQANPLGSGVHTIALQAARKQAIAN
jgi:alpha-L-rhamnosidase